MTALSQAGIQIVAQVGSLVGTVLIVVRVIMNWMEGRSAKLQEKDEPALATVSPTSSRSTLNDSGTRDTAPPPYPDKKRKKRAKHNADIDVELQQVDE